MKDVPMSLVKIPGIAALLCSNSAAEQASTTSTESTTALQVIDVACDYQLKASDPRLGIPRTASTMNRGLTKAREVLKERAVKRQDHLLKATNIGIKISVTIWESDTASCAKPKQVALSHLNHRKSFTKWFHSFPLFVFPKYIHHNVLWRRPWTTCFQKLNMNLVLRTHKPRDWIGTSSTCSYLIN